jgi:hypothetical protein
MPSKRRSLLAASGAGGDSLYVEDVFSTYLYAGNGSTQTLNNGIDLAGEGGLAWQKSRTSGFSYTSHILHDTASGFATKLLDTSSTAAAGTTTGAFTALSSGFSINGGFNDFGNASGENYASWTFRKAEKFFDVVTFTSASSGATTFNHSLGVPPAFIILKATGVASSWLCYHTSLGTSKYIELNSTAAEGSGTNWISVDSTSVTIGAGWAGTSRPYVAYLFASDAGGYGDDGDESVIKCGSYTTDGSGNATVNLGFEPQWILSKRTNATGAWYIRDVMRGMPVDGDNALLSPNTSGAEAASSFALRPSATGFTAFNDAASQTNIYIAIRRSMKTPESGTEVFMPVLQNGGALVTTGFPVDSFWSASTTLAGYGSNVADRLRGGGNYLDTRSSAAEDVNATQYLKFDNNTGVTDGLFNPSYPRAYWSFKRATGFMDVVCYTGDGTTPRNITHNLGVVPEFIVTKRRDVGGSWAVYNPDLGITSSSGIRLNTDDGSGYSQLTRYPSTPTSTVFTVGNDSDVNSNGNTFVSYLFATVAGVSKVGSYTGTAATLNVDCGFTAGARFILIKRYGSAGDWYTYDSARGIVAGNDPYLLLNTTAAEVTNTDYIDPLASGFTVTSTAPAALNASSGTYIFLAIA